MTALDHRIRTATVPVAVPDVRRAHGFFARLGENAYLRLLSAVIVVAAGLSGLALLIGFALDLAIPVVFGGELRALRALFPQVG